MKKVIIVGAGIAGLTAGVYARQSGFDVTIYEAHTIPGGASTSWRRKGYLFEGGMHWLTGSSPKSEINKLWREIGALDDSVSIYNRDPFFIYENNGKQVCLYRDIDKLKAHLLGISPMDEKEINRLCKDLKKFMKVQMPITNVKGVKRNNESKSERSFSLLSLFPMIPAILRMPFYSKQSADEYAMRYKSQLLQQLFINMIGSESSTMGLVLTLATLSSGDGGYPCGGSLDMAKRIAKKFIDLGGDIQYNTPIDKIICTNGIAGGVEISGNAVSADAVIVTQDTLVAVDRLFDKPLHEPWIEKMRQSTRPILNTFISIGIKADLSDIPESIVFSIDSPFFCGEQPIDSIGINNYASYQGYAPQGCTALTSIINGDTYDWWKKQKEAGNYELEKKKLAEAFISNLVKKYP